MLSFRLRLVIICLCLDMDPFIWKARSNEITLSVVVKQLSSIKPVCNKITGVQYSWDLGEIQPRWKFLIVYLWWGKKKCNKKHIYKSRLRDLKLETFIFPEMTWKWVRNGLDSKRVSKQNFFCRNTQFWKKFSGEGGDWVIFRKPSICLNPPLPFDHCSWPHLAIGTVL